MKPCTNKYLFLLPLGLLLTACSSKDPTPSVLPEESLPVQEVAYTQPMQAKPQEPAVQPQPAAAVAPAPIKRPAALSASEVASRLQAWDKKLQFLKTRFAQTTQYDGVVISKSQGVLFYDQAKHSLRLDTTDDEGKTEQSALTDKSQILILDGQGHEITTLSWQEWQQNQPNQALFDFGNYAALLARHHVELKEPYLLKLTPKEGEKYTLYLTLSQADYFPTRIQINSGLTQTQADLTDIEKNQPLPFDTFRAGGLFK